MGEEEREHELRELQRRVHEARDNWRRARDEMREAMRRSRHERRGGPPFDEARRAEMEQALAQMSEAAQELTSEIADEARRLAEEVWQGARHEWHGRWRDQFQRAWPKDWREHWVFGGRRFRQWTTGGEEVNPFVGAMLSRGGGLLALYVLHLLNEQPRHGNDVMRQIESRTMGSWASNPGAIYPLLSFMEEKGLVRSQWADPDKRTRRVYEITEEGRQELTSLSQVLRPKVMEAIEVLHLLYDDLYGREEQPAPPTPGQMPTGAEGATGGEAMPNVGSPAGQAPSGPDIAESSYAHEDKDWRARLGELFRLGSTGMATT